MEDQLEQSVESSSAIREFADAFDQCRNRARQAVESQRLRVREVETEFDSQVRALLAELETERDQLREDRAALERRNDETAAQRKRIARDLRAQRSEMLAEIAQKRAEQLQSATGEENTRLSQIISESTQLRHQLEQREQKLQSEQEQREQAQSECEQARLQREQAIAECEQAREQSRQSAKHYEAQLQEREAEIAALRDELAKAAAAPNNSAGGASLDEDEIDDLRRGRQMAIDELRDLKKKNDELQQQLKSRPGTAAPVAAGGAMDWAAQKARMLQQLEEDFDPEKSDEVRERLTIEKAIRATEKALAAKDEEIRELRRLLEDQSASIGGMAVGANAIAELLDHDELVREERENLKKVQEEWREKLRIAEVDISVERAKLARERAELEDRLQQLEQERAKMSVLETSDGKTKQPTRNKWLARLGLRDDD